MRPAAQSLFNAHPIPGAGLAAPPQPIESKTEVKARPKTSDRTEQSIFVFPSIEETISEDGNASFGQL